MYKPSIYLVVTYFPTNLIIYETCILQNWLPRWNQRFIEPAPTSAPLKMNDKWSENSFLLCSSSLANHGG